MQSCHPPYRIPLAAGKVGMGLLISYLALGALAADDGSRSEATSFVLGACQNRQTAQWGLCRTDGSAAPPIVAQRFSFIGAAGSGSDVDLFPAQERAGDPMGYLDSNGDWAVKPQFRQALPFTEGLAVVSDGVRSAAIDRQGKFVVPWFDGLMYPFSKGLACVVPDGSIRLGWPGRIRQKLLGRPGDDPYAAPWWKLKGRVGFVDATGRMAIQPRFEPRLNFLMAGCGFSSAGYAAMRQAGKEGLIDTRGDWVIEPRYDYLGMVFSGNRKVVALIAERTVKPGIFLDTIERLDGSMVPGKPVRWREAGLTQEVMVSGGLARSLLNSFLFPRWQQDLLNDDVSSRTLAAWLGSLALGVAAAVSVFRRFSLPGAAGHSLLRTAAALFVGVSAIALSFLAGLVSLYCTAGLLLITAAMTVRKWQRKKTVVQAN